MFEPTALARRAVETYVKEGRIIEAPGEIPPEFQRRRGVFVSLKAGGALRGCIGTIQPQNADIAAEIIANAVKAATKDPRFAPVRVDELPALVYSVDVLGPEEPVKTLRELDPKKYGVIVRRGPYLGLLLPDIAGVDDVETQLAIATRKAGLPRGADVKISRFTVTRYREDVDGRY